MIVDVKQDNIYLINKIESIFNDLYKQKNELKNEFISNPFTKLYAFIDNDNIMGIIHINDIYDRYEINNIFVLPKYRKQNIASNLMEKVLSEAEKNEKINITLEVRQDNIAAIKLYKKYGFIEKAIRKGYYKGIDGILMEKEMM